MDDEHYPIDVAFSFGQQDEELAVQLSEFLAGRLLPFVYSKRQDELVARDGEEKLNQVFARDAHIVVILHRDDWGKTPWTRIEETAIRNRAHEDGFDFTVFIPMQHPAALPSWVPRDRIWFNLDCWGAAAAAAIIERRVEETGGAVRAETAEDRATRLARDLAADNERQQFLISEAGVRSAEEEAGRLLEELRQVSEGLGFSVEHESQVCNVYNSGFTVSVAWSNPYANVTHDGRLHVKLWRGRPDIGHKRYASEPKELREYRFRFDRSPARGPGWSEDNRREEFRSTHQVSEICIDLLTEQIRKDRLRHR